jgi:hypothetical protein
MRKIAADTKSPRLSAVIIEAGKKLRARDFL